MAEPIEVLLSDGSLHEGIQQKVRDIVRPRTADQKFHRQVVDSFRVQTVVGAFGQHPALGKDISSRTGGRLKLFTRAGGCRGNDVVEEQMPLVKRVVSSGEAYRAATVLIEEVRAGHDGGCFTHGDFPSFTPRSGFGHRQDTPAPIVRASRGGVRSKPSPEEFPVIAEHAQGARVEQEVLPGERGMFIQRATRSRSSCPCANSATLPEAARARAITRSTLTPTCSGPSPLGIHPGRSASPAPFSRIYLAVTSLASTR